jgi:hypothetical protein
MNMEGVGGRISQRIWDLSTIGKLIGEYLHLLHSGENHLLVFGVIFFLERMPF